MSLLALVTATATPMGATPKPTAAPRQRQKRRSKGKSKQPPRIPPLVFPFYLVAALAFLAMAAWIRVALGLFMTPSSLPQANNDEDVDEEESTTKATTTPTVAGVRTMTQS
jgi:hypothetical protein